MEQNAGDEKMGRKKSVPTKNVRIHEDVYNKATIVAGYEEKDLALYLSEKLRPIVEEALIQHAQRTVAEAGKSKAAKKSGS